MQNLIIGKSGSGKGYEVCAYHILVALTQGRKVITNMPLVIEKWAAIDPSFPALIEMRKRAMPIRGTWEPTREQGAYHLFEDPADIIYPDVMARPFANVWDYYDTWRHPETKTGALFVIDEAQNVIPRGKTSVDVEEWSALHRHFVNDVLFITQSYGKLSQAIRDNIQMVYRLTKKVAWGQPNKYIRKVQDGIRGEVLNVTERTYNPAYFGLWVSQTQGGSGEEYGANDVVSIYGHWGFKGFGICMLLAVLLIGSTFLKDKESPPPPKVQPVQAEQPAQPAPQQPPPAEAQPRGPEQKVHPYQGNTMHLAAMARGKRFRDGVEQNYLNGFITIAQNGQPVSRVSFDDLREAGYQIEAQSNRIVSVTYKGYDVGYVVDDLPQVGLRGKVATAATP
jgi:zona occludens toxin